MMKRSAVIVNLLVFVFVVTIGNAQSSKRTSEQLYERLAELDSILFATVYTCNPAKAASFFTEDLEFYHDKGGVTKTKKSFIEALEKNFCGEQKQKLRRELVKGSMEVYPLGNYGAVQIGDHRFYVTENNQPERLSGIAKFVHVWHFQNGEWKISRVLSFDHKEAGSGEKTSKELFDTIARADELLFAAYNAHDLRKLQTGFTNDLEFYHDKDGLASYTQVYEGFKRIFDQNNGIKRELVAGSLEVYPMGDYGAIEIGSHQFCHKENGKDDCGTFPFIMLWLKQEKAWKISRVISYNH